MKKAPESYKQPTESRIKVDPRTDKPMFPTMSHYLPGKDEPHHKARGGGDAKRGLGFRKNG
jgi:hypothetical protein